MLLIICSSFILSSKHRPIRNRDSSNRAYSCRYFPLNFREEEMDSHCTPYVSDPLSRFRNLVFRYRNSANGILAKWISVMH